MSLLRTDNLIIHYSRWAPFKGSATGENPPISPYASPHVLKLLSILQRCKLQTYWEDLLICSIREECYCPGNVLGVVRLPHTHV